MGGAFLIVVFLDMSGTEDLQSTGFAHARVHSARNHV